jgi:hypothetical protein
MSQVPYLLLIGEKMTKRNKFITLTKLTSGLLVLVMAVSGCSAVKKAKSEAYNLGYQTGAEFTQLEDLGTLIDSYVPNDDDTSLGSITEEGVVAYCDAIWPITGLTAGIMNSAENKEQFVSGCADGYKSKL